MGAYLACDLGAESGRVVLGEYAQGKFGLQEAHRFPNVPIESNGSLSWNIEEISAQLRHGLTKAAKLHIPIHGLSTDSWGLDYLLYDAEGNSLPPAYHYRDPRTGKGVVTAHAKVSWEEIYAQTGIQFMPINTLYQLAAEPPERLARAARLLMIGDAINALFSNVAVAEESLASTSQLYNPRTHSWSTALMEKLGFPAGIFPTVVSSGTKLGPLLPGAQQSTGLGPIEIIASCSHDTGAAVAAVPAEGNNWAYISSGTWSLLGVEIASPILSAVCRDLNFTNEIGFGGSIRLLKNIVGLWIVQECRRAWAREGKEFSYGALARAAEDAAPFRSLIHPADARFVSLGRMPDKIADYCRETGQPAPRSEGEYVRCALESLALIYWKTLEELRGLTQTRVEKLHIVGGGSQNALLNQLTADAAGIPVLTGPVEATALGNVMVQAIACGEIRSVDEGRKAIRRSFPLQTYNPRSNPLMEQARERFMRLPNKTSF